MRQSGEREETPGRRNITWKSWSWQGAERGEPRRQEDGREAVLWRPRARGVLRRGIRELCRMFPCREVRQDRQALDCELGRGSPWLRVG